MFLGAILAKCLGHAVLAGTSVVGERNCDSVFIQRRKISGSGSRCENGPVTSKGRAVSTYLIRENWAKFGDAAVETIAQVISDNEESAFCDFCGFEHGEIRRIVLLLA